MASRPRAFVRVAGPDAEDYLQRMVSNDVAALEPGESCEALLLTPKARVIAPLRVLRRGADDFLLLTEPELGETRARPARAHAVRGQGRDRARGAHVDASSSASEPRGSRTDDYGEPAVEVLDADLEPTLDDERARAPADRGRHARLGQGDRRARAPRRGGARRARGQPHEGLLSGPGADRAPPLPRACEPRPARAPDRGRRASRSRTPSSVYGDKVVGRVTSAAARTAGSSRSPTCASRCRRTPSSASGDAKARPLH